SALTSGSLVDLIAGSYTAGGVTYGYRSDALAADSPLSEGSKSYSVTATDNVGHITTDSTFSVTVDNTAPSVTASAIAATSGGNPGYIAQGSVFYVYANTSDNYGIDSVTADISNVNGYNSPVVLVAGSYTVGGTTYGYRSGAF